MTATDIVLPDEARQEFEAGYRERRSAIRKRLEEFRAVPAERYFYELCYCLMTPQSSAAQCFAVAAELERRNFKENFFDPEALLRSFNGGYVRFHKTKTQRLLALRRSFDGIRELLEKTAHEKEIRDSLVAAVSGLGYKEASHFLRNIGRTRVTIIDRHIIRNLLRIGLLDSWPDSISKKRYLELESMFERLATSLRIPPDELDLLLWSRETGVILK
jgi:N-glycosylase/DNA lyase